MTVVDGPNLESSIPIRPEDRKENYAYDTRTMEVYLFRRLNSYVLLRTIPFNTFVKVSLEDFDSFFEGTPEPVPPLVVRTK